MPGIREQGGNVYARRASAVSLTAFAFACTNPVGIAVDRPEAARTASESDGSAPADTDGGTPLICRRLDVLFIVDSSVFMADKQRALADAVPSFIEAAWMALPLDSELHVGLTTTSFFAGSSSSQAVDCRAAFPERVAAHYVRPQDGTTGENGGQGRLFEHEGRRYFSARTAGPDRSRLEAWLASALAAVGSLGSTYTMPSAAAAYALHPANAAENEGFVRDEGAVLALFFLSAGIDTSPEETDDYATLVRAAKARCGGDACVVPGGLLSSCARDRSSADPLDRFVHAFGQVPAVGDVADSTGAAQPAEYARVGQELAVKIRSACLSMGTNARVEE
jgi:hypothetical protein